MEGIKSAGYKNYKKLTFSWEIITTCQYRCDYCYAYEILEKKFDPALMYIYKLPLAKLKLLPHKFDVELLGGEPTQHPELHNIVTRLTEIDNCDKIELVSNMVKPVEMYQELNYTKLTIAASYHPQYDKNNKYAKKCIAVANLPEAKIYCNVNLPKEETHWERIKSTVDILRSEGVDVGLNFIHSVKDRYDSYYTEKFKTMFHEYIYGDDPVKSKSFPYNISGKEQMLTEHEIKLKNLANFTGWSCTPLTYTIDVRGNMCNACSSKPVDIKNIIKTFKCPVRGGCNCDLLYTYYKERDDK